MKELIRGNGIITIYLGAGSTSKTISLEVKYIFVKHFLIIYVSCQQYGQLRASLGLMRSAFGIGLVYLMLSTISPLRQGLERR